MIGVLVLSVDASQPCLHPRPFVRAVQMRARRKKTDQPSWPAPAQRDGQGAKLGPGSAMPICEKCVNDPRAW